MPSCTYSRVMNFDGAIVPSNTTGYAITSDTSLDTSRLCLFPSDLSTPYHNACSRTSWPSRFNLHHELPVIPLAKCSAAMHYDLDRACCTHLTDDPRCCWKWNNLLIQL